MTLATFLRRQPISMLVAAILFFAAVLMPSVMMRLAPDIGGSLRCDEAVYRDRLSLSIPLKNGMTVMEQLFWRLPNQRSDDRAGIKVATRDGRNLGPPDTLHVDIAVLGGGRFSIWNDTAIVSMPEEAVTVDLLWEGRAVVRGWLSTASAVLSLVALVMMIRVFPLGTSAGFRSRARSFAFPMALTTCGSIGWVLLWQPAVNSTDTACLFRWPLSFMGHWPAVPCAIADLICSAVSIEYRAIAWLAIDIATYSVALALCASLLKRRSAQAVCIAFAFIVPIVPSIALSVAVDSGAVSGGIFVAFVLYLLDERGLDRTSASVLAICMVALMSTRHLGAALLCGAPLLILLRTLPSMRIRSCAMGCAILLVAFVFAGQLQSAVSTAYGKQYRAHPGRAAACCLSRVFYSAATMGVSEGEMIQELESSDHTEADRFVIRRAASMAASALHAWETNEAVRALSTGQPRRVARDGTEDVWRALPGGAWPEIVTAEGIDSWELEDAALRAYRTAAFSYPVAWWRVFSFWCSCSITPQWGGSIDVTRMRNGVDAILASEAQKEIHPIFATISRPDARSGPSGISGGMITAAFLALTLVAVATHRFRAIAPTAVFLSAFMGLVMYIAGSVAAILVWKLNYGAPAAALCTGILAIMAGRAIDAWMAARHSNNVSNLQRSGDS